MSVDSGEKVQDFGTVLVLTDEQTGYRKSDPQVAISTYFTVQESKKCFDSHVACQRSLDIGKENLIAFGPCCVDVDIEKGNLEKVKINEETGGSFNGGSFNADGSFKTEIALSKAALRRQNSLQTGGEATRPLMNHILMLLKLDQKDKRTERGHDATLNKWRKYKRPAAFDSRQVVLLFSILSSMGTIVLIYLTLRVRLAGESFILG